MVIESFGLSSISLQTISSILAECERLDSAIIYGSRALGTYKEGSDIDLTLIGQDLNFSDLLTIQSAFEQSDLPYYFDVSIYHKLDNPALINHIDRVGKLFYKRKSA